MAELCGAGGASAVAAAQTPDAPTESTEVGARGGGLDAAQERKKERKADRIRREEGKRREGRSDKEREGEKERK